MAGFGSFKNITRSNFNKVRNESRKTGSINNNRSLSVGSVTGAVDDPFRENLTEMEKKRRRQEKRNKQNSLFPSEFLIDPRLIALRERIPRGR